MSETLATPERPADRHVAITRLATGLLQGLALFGLSQAWTTHSWPATSNALFDALALSLAFAPLVVLGGAGRVRPVVLGLSTLVLGLAVAWFGWHGAVQQAGALYYGREPRSPDLPVILFGAAFVFIGHHVVAPADAAQRWIAPHTDYFDAAWKNGVQLALSAAFVGLLWAALALGAALFRLIGIHAFADLIGKRWFIFPVTCVALAGAVQLTDVRIGLILGIRTVGLALLSWLLPLMTLITVAFLAALPITGLKPLFATRSAAEILLSASAALVLLINAAYQEGRPERTHRVLRLAARVAGACLTPLIAVAAYALYERVAQYGWTSERVEATACVLIGAGYAVGYGLGAIGRTAAGKTLAWMRPLERTNVIMALAGLVAILALFTPIADPARLSVDDQVARLLDGRTPLARFDFEFLRGGAGHYGREALHRLQTISGGPTQRAVAAAANAPPPGGFPPRGGVVLPLARRMTVYPAGAVLPPEFIPQKAAALKSLGDGDESGPLGVVSSVAFGDVGCLTSDTDLCDVYVLDVDGDGQPELLITRSNPGSPVILEIFKRDKAGHWPNLGQLTVNCPATIAALRTGAFKLERIDAHELVVGDVHYRPVIDTDETCWAQWPKTLPAAY